MRLVKSTLGLRDEYRDRGKKVVNRNDMLPRLQIEPNCIMEAHQSHSANTYRSPRDKFLQPINVVPSNDSNQVVQVESGRIRKLSRKLSINLFRQWIQNQKGFLQNNSINLDLENNNNNNISKNLLQQTSHFKNNNSIITLDAAICDNSKLVKSNLNLNQVDSNVMCIKTSSLSPTSSGTSHDQVKLSSTNMNHSYHLTKPQHDHQSIKSKNSQILNRSSSPPPPPPPPPYRSPRRRIYNSRHPSLPSLSTHQSNSINPHHIRSPSSTPHLNLTHSSTPPSHLISLPICSNRFGIPCVIDMASNSPPLRQPVPNLLSSSPPLSPLTPSVLSSDLASKNDQSDTRIPLPPRDDLSIIHAAPGIGNKVTYLDQNLPPLDNLCLGPNSFNKTIDSSASSSSSPSSHEPQLSTVTSHSPLNSLLTNGPLSPERHLSIVEEDPPPNRVRLVSFAPKATSCNDSQSVSMLEPNHPSLSPSNSSLSTIHPNQMLPTEIISRSPTRSPAGPFPDTSIAPDHLLSSGPSTRFVKSAPTTKVDVSHKQGETHVTTKPPGTAEKKSVFGKLFDRRTDVKSSGAGGSTSTEGSGNESESNPPGLGTVTRKSVSRKNSTKVAAHASDACSNPASVVLNEHEAISGPRLLALQGSIAPPLTGGRSKAGSERGGEDKPFGGSSKLRDMVGGKLGRKPSSSKGGRSEDGKSDDGENRSRAGSQATTSLLKKYGVCEKVAIGKGATAVVRLAHKWDRGTDKLYAVKEFRKRRKNESEKEYVKKLTSEFCISSTLHHENIVETVDLVQDANQHWCEVMEYCPGGDLYAAIKRGSMKQHEINSYFKQLLNGIAYLHQMGVAHRDIKPENLLLDGKGRIKITDFGVSDVFRMCWEQTAHLSKGLCGSEPYLPKEIFERKEYDARLVDVWSCGIVYYCCCIQELPWRVAKKTDPSYMSFVESYESSLTPTPLINLTKDSRKIIKKMLHPEPEGRVQIDEVLQDEWVTNLQILAV